MAQSPTWEVEVKPGVKYQVDAPDEQTAWTWANATHKKESEITGSGLLREGGKGLLRGASQVAEGVAGGATSLLLGPIGGPMAMRGIKSLSLPSREQVEATPKNEPERFAGTAGEIAGGSIAGGGANTIRNSVVTGGAALGGATGEQIGGDIGKFVGIVAGTSGTQMATALLRKLGTVGADIGATVGAAFGNERGIERLASKAVTAKAGTQAPAIVKALESPTEYVPGAKTSAAEAIAEAQTGAKTQFGGSLARMQKDLHGAPGVEDVLPGAARQQATAIETHLADLARKTGPMRENALNAANASGGVKIAPVLEQIDAIGAEPGVGASKVIQKVLATVKEDVGRITKDGVANAKDLYTVRKEIGNTIQLHAKETANWDKHLSSGLQRRVQVAIDDAIVASGGKGWKEYLMTESFGRKAVENMQDRQKAMKLLQAQVKGQSPAQVVSGEVLHPPTLLNRGMMLVNYGLKLIAHDANDPVVKRVATAMRDSRDLAELIKLPINHPDRKAMNVIINALVATKLDEAAQQAVTE